MLLKREIGPTIVCHWSGCGGGLMASRGRFLGRGSWLQFRNKSASISPLNILHFSRDRAMIGPRSRHDRATIVILVVRRSTSSRLAAIPPCKLHDRGSIAPRSRLDRAAILEFFQNPSTPSDRSSSDWRVTIARSRSTLLVRRMAIQPC